MNFYYSLEPYMLFIYGVLVFWIIFSIVLMFRLYRLGTDRVNPYIYDSIPSVFTTLGVLGTFIGIYAGLSHFDVQDITGSIPPLLEGMKTAFATSIAGIVLSVIFGKMSQLVVRSVEKNEPKKSTGEIALFQEMVGILGLAHRDSNENFKNLNNALISDNDDSLTTQFVKLRNLYSDTDTSIKKQTGFLEQMQISLGGNGETSLLTQIQKLRAEQNEYSKKQEKNVDFIVESMYTNNQLISQKFDEFSKLLAKNNTEALVEVMKQATEQFNEQMSALIEKLVQENFKELNNSVQQMNSWQKENKEMISVLTGQFQQVSKEFEISSKAINEITENTNKLTNDNSHLTKLIEELQKVMIDDTKYQEIVNNLVETINTLKGNTEAFDNTTNKLNDWVRNQMNFTDSVAVLMTRLEEIDKIKDINEAFWENTKKQLNQGVSIIENASKSLSNDLDNINDQFYAQLNDTLQNLDALIQRIIANYNN